MKVIIAGGKNYRFTEEDFERLKKIKHLISQVVSGGAKGADKEGEDWAIANKIPLKVFKAEWNRYGRAAGPIRNKQMAQYADAVVLFPGGSGTDNMYANAVKHGLKIYDYRNKNNFKEWLCVNEGFGFDWSKLPNARNFIKDSAVSIDVKSTLKDRAKFLYGKNKFRQSLQAILGKLVSVNDFEVLIKNIAIKNLKQTILKSGSIVRAATYLEGKLSLFVKQQNQQAIADEIISLYSIKSPNMDFNIEKALMDYDKNIGLIYFSEEDLPQDIFRIKPLYERKKLNVMKNKHQKHGVDVTIYYAFKLAPTKKLNNLLNQEDDNEPYSYSDGNISIDPSGWRERWKNILKEIADKSKLLSRIRNSKDINNFKYDYIEKSYKQDIDFILQNPQIKTYNLDVYYREYKNLKNLSQESNKDPVSYGIFKAILNFIDDIKPQIDKIEKEIKELKKEQQELRKSHLKPTHAIRPNSRMTLKNKKRGNIGQFLSNAVKAFTKIMKHPVTDQQKFNRLQFAEQSAQLYKNANPDRKVDIIIYPESSSGLVKDIASEFLITYNNAKAIEGFKKIPKEQIKIDYEKAKRLNKSQTFIDNMKNAEEIIRASGDNKSLKGRNEAYRHYINLYYMDIPENLDLNGKNILVIDDIGTTGSTMQYIKEELEKNYTPGSIEFYVPLTS